MTAQELISTFARLRQERGLSMAQLARKVGLTAGQINNVEKGHNGTTPERLEDWARALGYRLDLRLVPAGANEAVAEAVTSATALLSPEQMALVADFAALLPRLTEREQRVWRAELQALRDEPATSSSSARSSDRR